MGKSNLKHVMKKEFGELHLLPAELLRIVGKLSEEGVRPDEVLHLPVWYSSSPGMLKKELNGCGSVSLDELSISLIDLNEIRSKYGNYMLAQFFFDVPVYTAYIGDTLCYLAFVTVRHQQPLALRSYAHIN